MAAKAGLLGLCNAVALEGEPFGIRANCVLPVAQTRMAEGTDLSILRPVDLERMAGVGPLRDTMQPEFVTPMVVYLASEACAVSQQAFSAVYGRFARVFVGVTSGWYGPRSAPASAEAVRDHMAEIGDRSRWFVPETVFEESGLVIANLPR